MKRIKNALQITLLIFVTSAFVAATIPDQNPWEVPTKYVKMSNPTDASDAENIALGKQLYMKHCKSCHGKDGLGDGPKAAELDTECGDFSSADFQSQGDGELFYKTTFGRDDMPAFEKKIPNDEDRWLVVNFMRTMGE